MHSPTQQTTFEFDRDIPDSFEADDQVVNERRNSFYVLPFSIEGISRQLCEIKINEAEKRSLRPKKAISHLEEVVTKRQLKGIRKKKKKNVNVDINVFSDNINLLSPGTPSYKQTFKKLKREKTKELFILYNNTIFNDTLPSDLKIIWSKRMLVNAGFTHLITNEEGERSSKVELCEKVVDNVDRLRETLVHQLCPVKVYDLT